jgi:5-methylcytosine-specific restriction endonuclease McrA
VTRQAEYHRLKQQSDPAYRAKKAARAKAWREANPERAKAAQKRCYEAKKTEYLAKNKANRDAEDPAVTRARHQAWRDANRHKLRIQSQRRRARRCKGGDLTADEWLMVLEEFDHQCAYCGVGEVDLQIEHMIPLARGGRHTVTNVVPACGPCNLRKGTKTLLEFLAA